MTVDLRRRPRVVLADDHPSVLAAFVRMLQSSCDVVASVCNGLAAVEAMARLRADVLVVDLIMPDLDGLEVCRRVKRIASEIDVIIVTAFDDSHVQAVALQNGASAYVPKHSAAGTLEDTIHRIFAERQTIPTEADGSSDDVKKPESGMVGADGIEPSTPRV
jgi:DNA-binding NarL/FixJ family response regulator